MPVMAIPRKTSREVRRVDGFELSIGMKREQGEQGTGDRGAGGSLSGAGENIILEVGLKVI